eukprot:1886009-Rhodomonas_salina.1
MPRKRERGEEGRGGHGREREVWLEVRVRHPLQLLVSLTETERMPAHFVPPLPSQYRASHVRTIPAVGTGHRLGAW